MNRTGRPEKAARSAFALRCRKIFSRRRHKAHSMHLHLSGDLA